MDRQNTKRRIQLSLQTQTQKDKHRQLNRERHMQRKAGKHRKSDTERQADKQRKTDTQRQVETKKERQTDSAWYNLTDIGRRTVFDTIWQTQADGQCLVQSDRHRQMDSVCYWPDRKCWELGPKARRASWSCFSLSSIAICKAFHLSHVHMWFTFPSVTHRQLFDFQSITHTLLKFQPVT